MASKSRVQHTSTMSNACVLAAIVLLAVVRLAAAQSAAATAGITGRVTDPDGLAIPGVAVAATSPALQVPQVATITDERGEYRLSPLPIGTYTVTYQLDGFQSVRREEVRLTVRFVAQLDQVLTLSSVQETVTVVAASPLVDVTSTATSTELSRAQLDLLPTSRDGLKAFLGQVPGMRTNQDVGPSSLTGAVEMKSYGQSGETWQMLEGVLASSPTTSGNEGSHMNFSSLEGVRVQTVGSNAEMPRRGILLDAVVNSGGNDLHGDAFAFWSAPRLESRNVDAALRAQGVRGAPALHGVRDLAASLGGRIIDNRLWFYGASSYKSVDREIFDAFYDDGTPVVEERNATYYLGKVSYQIDPANKLIGFGHRATENNTRGASRFVPADSRERAYGPIDLMKAEWQGLLGDALVVSVQHGYWHMFTKSDGFAPGKPLSLDIATLFVSGDHERDGRRRHYDRHHSKAAVSWYRPDLLGGDHELKVGFDRLLSGVSSGFLSRRSGNYQLRLNNGAPFELTTFNYPVTPENSDHWIGLYGQDAWTINRRLTLNVGVRYARDNGYVPEQCREEGDFVRAQCFPKVQMRIWHSFVPRLHLALDVTGDGKTVLKGGWGRFSHLREILSEVTALNRNTATETTWRWRDLNGNRDYDAGEVNLDPNGPDFLRIAAGALAGATGAIPNTDEKQPMADEFSLTLERQLAGNWAARVTGVYARNTNTYRLIETRRPYEAYSIPITRADPGPDGAVGTGDDPGAAFTYYEYPSALQGLDFAETMLINHPSGDHHYATIEASTTKRLSQGWQFQASYVATKKNIPFKPANPFTANAAPFNPNAEVNQADRTWEWQGKVSGTYAFPHGLVASASFESRSGEPQARQVLFTGGTVIRSIALNVEPLGARRLPTVNLLDLRAAKRFTPRAGHVLELRADVYNALNVNTVTARVLRSGPTFLLPTSIVLPRLLQLGVSYIF